VIVLNQLQKRFSRSFARIARRGSEKSTNYIYLLIAIFIALFLQAYIHNYNIVYLALFFTFAFSFSGYFVGRDNIRSLEVKFLSSERVFANRECSYSLLLSSSSQRDVYDVTCITRGESKHYKFIRSNRPEVVTFSHRFSQRGDKEFGTVECQSRFPLPHQIFYKVFDLERAFVVYPEPKGTGLDAFLAQNRSLYGDREDFEGVKAYGGGDRLSQIYWPSLAKGDSLMSKVFSHTDEAQLLDFDFLSCGRSDEQRLSQLTLWVLECEQRGYAYRIDFGHKRVDSRKMGTDEILAYLGRY